MRKQVNTKELPSLYAGSDLNEEERQVFPILGLLEPKKSLKQSTRRWSIVAAILLLPASILIAFSSFFPSMPFSTADEKSGPINPTVHPVQGVVKPALSGPISAATAGAHVGEVPPRVAVIAENDVKSSKKIESNNVSEEKLNATAKNLSETKPQEIPLALTKSGPLPVRTSAEKSGKENHTGEQVSLKEKNAASKTEGKPAKKSSHQVATSSPTKSAASKDKDVELIAALLQHAPSPSTDSKDKKLKSPNNISGGSAVIPGKRTKIAETETRVANRSGSESTDASLKRCQALGFFESEVCRIRTCSGKWGIDKACPTNVPAISN